ncbi:MAG: penicillin-binding protein activator LpoB, partial [Leptothrix sp. (in: b-proteobacteria)]
VERAPAGAPLQSGATWVLLPLANHTETPQAGRRAEAILEPLLLHRGVTRLLRAPGADGDALFDAADRKSQLEAQRWAIAQGARYAIGGAVDEWRYKVGVDGEPAAGVALQVIDLQSGAVVWSAVGGQSGWSREALSAVAQKLMADLLGDLVLR